MTRTGRFRDEDWESLELTPSKTEQKRTMERLQALGLHLTTLPVKQLAMLPLSERVVDELKALSRITSFEARRRQSQLIGKFLRDEDIDALIMQLVAWQPPKLQAQLDRWVERVIESEEEAIREYCRQYREIERHTLRQYVMRVKSQEDPAVFEQMKIRLRTYLAQGMLL